MQLRDIRYVVAIAEAGNFSRAAEQLYISQPALSRLVRRLEDELGVRLFAREHNAVTLTYAGRVFVKDSQQILDMSEHVKKKMSDIQELCSGEFTVSVSPFYQKFLLTHIFPEFHRQYPGIKPLILDAFASESEERLLKGSVEVAILPSPRELPGIQAELLFWDDILLAMPCDHPMTDLIRASPRQGLDLRELALLKNEPFIMYKQGRRLRNLCSDLFREAGFEPNIVLETHSCENLFALVMEGMGLGFVPMATPGFFPSAKRPVCCHINYPRATRKIVIAYREGYFSAAAREFVRICRDRIAQILPEITYRATSFCRRRRERKPQSD